MAKLSLKFPPIGAKIGKKLGKKGKKIGKRSAMPLVPYPIPLKKLQKKLAPKGKIIGKFSKNLHGDIEHSKSKTLYAKYSDTNSITQRLNECV